MKLARAKIVVILLTLAGLLFSAGIAIFLFVPTFQEIGRLSDEIVREHSQLEAQYVNRKNLLSSGEKAKAVRGTITTLASQFLPDGHELDFITAVESIAAKNGVEERLVLSPATTKGTIEIHVGFDITLSGSTPAVLQTLVDLERMPTLLIFDSAVLRPGENGGDGHSFLSINLRGALIAPPTGL